MPDLSRRGALALAAAGTVAARPALAAEPDPFAAQVDLVFRDNLIGIVSQYRPFAPELSRRDAPAGGAMLDALRAVMAEVNAVYGNEPGRQLYSTVRTTERRAIARGAYANRDALARASEALGTA